MVCAWPGVIDGAVVEIPEMRQALFLAREPLEHLIANLCDSTLMVPNAHFIDLAAKGAVGWVIGESASEQIGLHRVNVGEGSGVGVLRDEAAVGVQFHSTREIGRASCRERVWS